MPRYEVSQLPHLILIQSNKAIILAIVIRHLILLHILILFLFLSSQTMTIAAVDETDYNLWLDALSDTLEIREMAIQVHHIPEQSSYPRWNLSIRFIQHIMIRDIKFDHVFLDLIPHLTGAMSSLVYVLSIQLSMDVTSSAYFY